MKKALLAIALLIANAVLVHGSASAVAPAFAWDEPVSGSTVSGAVTFKATAAAADGKWIDQWCLTLDGEILPSDPAVNAYPYVFLESYGTYDYTSGCWNSSGMSLTRGAFILDTTTWENDTYSLRVVIRDSSGTTTESGTFNFTTLNVDPSFTWVSPSDGSAVAGVVTVKARATVDPLGTATVQQWCLKINDEIVVEDLSANISPFTWLNNYSDYDSNSGCWNSSGMSLATGALQFDTTTWINGNYEFNVVVTDSSGRSVTSTLNLSVNNLGPTFSWITPSHDAIVDDLVILRATSLPSPSGTASGPTKWCLTIDGQAVSENLAATVPGFSDLLSADFNDDAGCWERIAGIRNGSIEFDTSFLSLASKLTNATTTSTLNIRSFDSNFRSTLSAAVVFSATNGVVTSQILPNDGAPNITPFLVLGARTSSSAAVSVAPPENDSPEIQGYKFRYSDDFGESWNTFEKVGSNHTFTDIPYASAILVQAAGFNSDGVGPWSQVTVLTSKGARPNRVEVIDAWGQPVSGGGITWAMVNEPTRSSKTFGLTSDGVIDFPFTPAGWVDITISNATLEDGVTVSGTARTILGFPRLILQLPEQSPSNRKVFVHLPESMTGVADVAISLDGNLRRQEKVDEFIFSVDRLVETGQTDQSGELTLIGFDQSHSGLTVAANYDDGTINQTKYGLLTATGVDIELDYIPFVTFNREIVNADLNETIPVVVQLHTPFSITKPLAPIATKNVTVELIPPLGAETRSCGNSGKIKLKGSLGLDGKVSLRVCANVSGVYKVKARGAATTGSLVVLVKGAPSLPVTSLHLSSKKVGQITAAWSAPSYAGGLKILDYQVTIRGGGKTIQKVARELRVSMGGLKNATRYSVVIRARTKAGLGAPMSAMVSVA